jgi:mono/diheme cytochrome c family protein
MNLRKPIVAILLLAATATNAAELSTPQVQGRTLFAKHCAACHGERGFATAQIEKRLGKDQAMLERRTDLNDALIKHVVRHGIKSMPWFTRVELSDADAAAIADYLTRTSR